MYMLILCYHQLLCTLSDLHYYGLDVASYPGLPMFFNVHEKSREGLVDLCDVMDVVCDDAHWNE